MSIDEDLIQDGYVGLWRAALRYNPASGTLFSTYAVKAIRNSIYNAQNKKLKSVQPSCSLFDPADDGGKITFMDRLKDPNSEKRYAEVELSDFIERELTEEEQEVLRYRMAGMGARKIAARFGRSETWGSTRLRRLKEKFKKKEN